MSLLLMRGCVCMLAPWNPAEMVPQANQILLCMQRPRQAYSMELTNFHSEDYINFLARVTPDNADELQACLPPRCGSCRLCMLGWGAHAT